MPIGVPRIIYCWGEELPAQWTDIYNFIFRRRMVFLMQYLDDELCNQICGLLINIHMEDRSKELEKKEMENSGLFKSPTKQQKQKQQPNQKDEKSIEDLMMSEKDLEIDENYFLERYTLQKMTLDWLNWNAQFFDYSEQPYLFYLAEILSKDFVDSQGNLFYDSGANNKKYSFEFPKFLNFFKKLENFHPKWSNTYSGDLYSPSLKHLDVYSPFRYVTNFASLESGNVSLNWPQDSLFESIKTDFYNGQTPVSDKNEFNISGESNIRSFDTYFSKFLADVAQQDFSNKIKSPQSTEKAFAQRQLRRDYGLEYQQPLRPSSYLDLETSDSTYLELRDYYRKQTERALQDEETKKVFVIINSFGGSVGNGITLHDALQFIKAGSLTLGLGVAASAASLALAGGTIGERYITEGCHVMIHQPEGGLTGQASDIWIDSQEVMKIRLDVAEIYSLSTYRPRHQILKDLDRDFYLNATETIFYGLADEIATNEVMHEIIEMTSKVWDVDESKQQRLLESREGIASGLETQTQS
uniref:ATP-dependent Clp protease proteolytic subunit n=1 Tax=Jenufa minuta TaxID=993092 RepID=A0A0S2LNE4_JENMI|nr:proteolytic subunit 2 of clp protease [Jenufa minuta]ALO62943.1 proteolytic subunit 2 of clp protease [Jenufa minuta]